jgi:multidrug efflux system membrane fusion protein
MSSKLIAVLIAFVAFIWIGTGLLFGGGAQETDPPPTATQAQTEKNLVEVRVRELEARPYDEDVVVTGRSRASRYVAMAAETDGQVIEILKEEGDTVTKGDILARLELRDRKARAEEAEKRLQQREIEFNAAQKLETQGFNSRVRLAQAKADLEEAKAMLEQARVELAKTDITAPYDSVISIQHIEIGDYVTAGGALFDIVALDPIELVGFVSERRVQHLKLGTEAEAIFLNGDTLTGTLTYIAPAADPQTRTFRVIMSAPNPELAVKEGLTAEVHIPVSARQAHEISPAILSLNTQGQVGVKIVNGEDKVEFVPVRILSDKAGSMWITGAPNKARFITVGQDFVIEGQTVKPVPADGDGLL